MESKEEKEDVDKKISKDIIIDAEWEEYDPKENKIDTYV